MRIMGAAPSESRRMPAKRALHQLLAERYRASARDQTKRAPTAKITDHERAIATARGSTRASSASAGVVVMIASGTTKVNTSETTPRKTAAGQRAASNTDAKNTVRLSMRTT